MKKNIRQNLRNTKGITLIALIITIIVLLILAGVSLSMVLNQDGIFSRAEQATEEYGQAKARETLEIVLSDAQMKKYESGLTETELDNKISEVGSLIAKEDENSNNQLVIVDGHIFEINRSVPKIVDYKGPANGVIVTARVTQNGDWQNPVATVTGTITKYGGGSVVSTMATATNNVTIPVDFPTTGGSYTIPNITTDTEITITTTDSDGKTATKIINVRLVRDTTPPEINSVDIRVDKQKIIIKANAIDKESGIKKFGYSITPETITEPAGGKLISGEETILNALKEGIEYTVTISAIDNAENKTVYPSKTLKTSGVTKHIKTETGLKEVNTLDIYGAIVNGYNCSRTDTQWQIFYIDEKDDNRVYLISKEHAVPPTNNSKIQLQEVEEMAKAYRFGADTSDQSILKNFTRNLPLASATTPLGRFMRDFLSEYAGLSASSSQPNLQATNLMINQEMWSEYKGEKADLAFGGPTLHLFQASYNDICKKATKLGIQQSGTGYQISLGTSESYSTGVGFFGDESTQNGIYFKPMSSTYGGFWIASPSSADMNCLFATNKTGKITSPEYNYEYRGFCPIVSLKTDVKFVSNEDGSYTIVN